jgi:hypothetical protein
MPGKSNSQRFYVTRPRRSPASPGWAPPLRRHVLGGRPRGIRLRSRPPIGEPEDCARGRRCPTNGRDVDLASGRRAETPLIRPTLWTERDARHSDRAAGERVPGVEGLGRRSGPRPALRTTNAATSTARLEWSTLAAVIARCSVNAWGRALANFRRDRWSRCATTCDSGPCRISIPKPERPGSAAARSAVRCNRLLDGLHSRTARHRAMELA